MKISKKKWPVLKLGDIVDIVAPAKIGNKEEIEKAKLFIRTLGLIPRIDYNLVAASVDSDNQDPFSINTDKQRFESLNQTLFAQDSKLLWPIRGGYGCSRIINELEKLTPPEHSKLLIGFSDIIVLHIFLQQKWGWASLHANCLLQYTQDDVDEKSVNEIKNIIFGETKQIIFSNLEALNNYKPNIIETDIIGGNLCLIETSIGTSWQVDAAGKILLLEDINEKGYSVDRSLMHLKQANLLKDVKAIIFGTFTGIDEREAHLVLYALKRFAESVDIPVLMTNEVGHIAGNRPIPLGTHCVLNLDNFSLVCETGVDTELECKVNGDSWVFEGLGGIC